MTTEKHTSDRYTIKCSKEDWCKGCLICVESILKKALAQKDYVSDEREGCSDKDEN